MYRRIMIVIADRPEAKAALDEGVELARVHGAEVLLVHVLPYPNAGLAAELGVVSAPAPQDAERALREFGDRLLADARARAERLGVSRRMLVLNGDPVSSITGAARERLCDLIVAGAEPRNAVMRILTGSVIPGLITQAPVPVLVCHERAAPGTVHPPA
jgi:nucleotide-binding universal stress UspA family protein